MATECTRSIDADAKFTFVSDATSRRLTGWGADELLGRHFGALLPHLRIPFGGRPEAREALLGRLASLGNSDGAQLLGVGDQVDLDDPAA